MAMDRPLPPPPPGGGPGFTPLLPAPPSNPPWQGPPRPNRRLRTLGVGAAIFVVVAGGISAALIAFVALRGTGDVLTKLIPNDAAFSLSIYLDPPASQKSNFNNLLHKFPDVKDDQARDKKVNAVIDEALKRSHLNHNDVKAWLGSQVALIAPADVLDSGSLGSRAPGGGAATSSPPQFAILVSSTDAKKAQATLQSFRNNDDGKAFTWTDDSHDGVSVARGTPTSGGLPLLYSVVDHAAVFSSSFSFMNDIIDTAHGKRAALDTVDSYKKAISGLPSDHLALAYANMEAVAGKLKDELHKPKSGIPASATQSIEATLNSLRGLAFTVSAQPNGFALDGNSYLDPSKLTDQQRQLRQSLMGGRSVNGTLGSIPAGAYGFLAFGGADKIVQSVADLLGPIDPTVQQGLEKLGVTGPNGIARHLTGDAGLEVGPRPDSKVPGGALLLATDDAAAMGQFLGNIADVTAVGTSGGFTNSTSRSSASGAGCGCPASRPPAGITFPAQPGLPAPAAGDPGFSSSPISTPGGSQVAQLVASPAVPTPTPASSANRRSVPARPAVDPGVVHVKVMYQGVEITTSGTLASDPHGILPSYAVSKGIGILGTSVEDVKAAIDAQAGAGIGSAAPYKDAAAQAPKDSSTAFFLNIPAVVAAVRGSLGQADRDTFDRTAAADVAPLKSLIVTGQSSSDHDSVRVFVTLG